MLGDPLFLHFDYMQFAQFTDGLDLLDAYPPLIHPETP